jgi:glycine/sarcosine N-methyltransferase
VNSQEPKSATRGVGYDTMVDWDKRLARELPFLQAVFAEAHEVRRILDVGAGTGRHAAALAQLGYEVTGVDPDPDMLARARDNAASRGLDVRFVEGGFGDLEALGLGPVDALICTGNALPHVEGIAGLDAALRDMEAVLRPGGVIVLHLLNHARLLKSRVRSTPTVVRDHDGETSVFLRLLEYEPVGAPERIWVEFVTAARGPAGQGADEPDLGWSITAHRSPHTAMPFPVLCGALERSGFFEVRPFGDHTGKEYEPAKDESLLVTARRERRACPR